MENRFWTKFRDLISVSPENDWEDCLHKLEILLKNSLDYRKQIAELQDKLATAEKSFDLIERDRQKTLTLLADTKDKLHRRNLQIADLKKNISQKIYCDICGEREATDFTCALCYGINR